MHIPPEMFKVEVVMVILSATVVLIQIHFSHCSTLEITRIGGSALDSGNFHQGPNSFLFVMQLLDGWL